MKWIWIALGLGAGFVLGSRAGREQYQRITRWTRGTAQDLGIADAAGQITDSAKSAGGTLHDVAASHARSMAGTVADAVTDRIDSAADSVSS